MLSPGRLHILPLQTDQDIIQSLREDLREGSSCQEDPTTEQGPLGLWILKYFSQALLFLQEVLQAVLTQADSSSFAGGGTTGLSCQASLSPASSLASNRAHPPGLFPAVCTLQAVTPRGWERTRCQAGLGWAEEQQPGCTGRMTPRFHPPTSLPTVQNPGQPGSAQQLSSAYLQTTEERRREAAVGGCALVCWKKLSSQNQEERAGKNRVGGAVWGLQPSGPPRRGAPG